jgi:hypothetical protein
MIRGNEGVVPGHAFRLGRGQLQRTGASLLRTARDVDLVAEGVRLRGQGRDHERVLALIQERQGLRRQLVLDLGLEPSLQLPVNVQPRRGHEQVAERGRDVKALGRRVLLHEANLARAPGILLDVAKGLGRVVGGEQAVQLMEADAPRSVLITVAVERVLALRPVEHGVHALILPQELAEALEGAVLGHVPGRGQVDQALPDLDVVNAILMEGLEDGPGQVGPSGHGTAEVIGRARANELSPKQIVHAVLGVGSPKDFGRGPARGRGEGRADDRREDHARGEREGLRVPADHESHPVSHGRRRLGEMLR